MLPAIKNILYATDLSDANAPVYRFAMSLAERYGARLTVLHVLEPLTPFARAFVEEQVPREKLDALRDEGMGRVVARIQAEVEEFCRKELADPSQADERIGDIIVEQGQPTDLILKRAKDKAADLIVLGSHGHSTIGEILIGSTAHKVSQRSRVPVLLVPVSG